MRVVQTAKKRTENENIQSPVEDKSGEVEAEDQQSSNDAQLDHSDMDLHPRVDLNRFAFQPVALRREVVVAVGVVGFVEKHGTKSDEGPGKNVVLIPEGDVVPGVVRKNGDDQSENPQNSAYNQISSSSDRFLKTVFDNINSNQ